MNSTQASRLIENEAVFRKYNEQVENGFEDLKNLADEDGSEDITKGVDQMNFQFFCECSDEECKGRIKMKLADYSTIHKNRSRFIVLPDHQVVAVEKVIEEKATFTIVEKLQKPPTNPNTLHKTDVHNV